KRVSRTRATAYLRHGAREGEGVDRQVVVSAVEDLLAGLQRLGKADMSARPLAPRLGAEEGLAEELRELVRAVDGYRFGGSGQLAIPDQIHGVPDSVRNSG